MKTLAPWFLLLWQIPQLITGLLFVSFLFIIGECKYVGYYLDAYIFEAPFIRGAISFGPIIVGPKNLVANHTDHLLLHELGHSLQSKYLGPLYLFIIGIPSLISAATFPALHGTRWFETWANRLICNYMEKSIPDFTRESYVKRSVPSSYKNYRRNDYNLTENKLQTVFRSFDIVLIALALFALLIFIYSLVEVGFYFFQHDIMG